MGAFMGPTEPNVNLENALRLVVDYGLSIFPVIAAGPGAKKPFKDFAWKRESTANISRILQFAKQYPGCAWAIDCSKSKLVVVDPDVKRGKDGVLQWLILESLYGASITLQIETPSGGLHVYYRQCADKPLGCKRGALPNSIDVRGEGGYVVAPGQRIEAGVYKVINDSPIVGLPQWLHVRVGVVEAKALSEDGGEPRDIEELLSVVPFSTLQLLDVSPQEGQRSDHSYRVCAELFTLGLTKREVYDLISDTPCIEKYQARGDLADDIDRNWARWKRVASPSAVFGGVQLPSVLSEYRPPKVTPASIPLSEGLVATLLDDVQMEQIEWLWEERIARGKLNVIAGLPKTAKSSILADLAARISQGATWPDGTPIEAPGKVLIIQAEDGVADTVKPRVVVAGGDCKKILEARSVRLKAGAGFVERQLALSTDIQQIDRLFEQHPDIVCVMLDALTSFLGPIDSHKDAEVRAVLTPLAAWAEQRKVTVLAVHHLNKGGSARTLLERMAGSAAFTQVARVVHMVVKDPEDEEGERRVLQPLVQNVGRPQEGIAFTVETAFAQDPKHPKGVKTSRVVWGGTAEVDLHTAVNKPEGRKAVALEGAIDWLKKELKVGARYSTDIADLAAKNGISTRTLERARSEIGVLSYRELRGDKWMLQLPQRRETEEKL